MPTHALCDGGTEAGRVCTRREPTRVSDIDAEPHHIAGWDGCVRLCPGAPIKGAHPSETHRPALSHANCLLGPFPVAEMLCWKQKRMPCHAGTRWLTVLTLTLLTWFAWRGRRWAWVRRAGVCGSNTATPPQPSSQVPPDTNCEQRAILA
eukprot:3128795-Rhodomonas_salina.3